MHSLKIVCRKVATYTWTEPIGLIKVKAKVESTVCTFW